jgi:cyclic beta-1,2-glucan synthetase
MSYRLKQYGRRAYAFSNVLEEQVNKMGLSISDVIQKEHFDIALKKVSMGNSITSINTIMRVNFLEIFEKINGVEELLKDDPADVYNKMDYKSKSYYRKQIESISKKTKISEMYIAKKCLELAKKGKKGKQSHIGYYLISKGKNVLLSELTNKKIRSVNPETKKKIYILGISVLSVLFSLVCALYVENATGNMLISLALFITTLIPSQTIVVQLIQYILSKIIKPKILPKLDFKSGIPEEYSTMVIIPTIIKNKEKVCELFSKLEVYYIANKSKNLYLTLLADCSSGKNYVEKYDDEIIQAGIDQINRLNKKYPDENFNKFNFIYRERKWNDKEDCYLGWERKRGAINQFNEYILGNIKNPFLYNSFEDKDTIDKTLSIPKIKYIITLDGDTDLVLNSGLELIGAMAHILNKPIIDQNKNVVVDGHALMQPRIGIGLLDAGKSKFTKIFSGLGGTDSYVNAVFDVYQDNFDEGIFTGKGIYDLSVFSKILKNEIPENTVLSHDLLEGSYLRCGMISDVMLMDGYPSNYLAFKKRMHRWIRGDYQIIKWIKSRKLNILSKYKIVDNILRSKLETSILISILLSSIAKYSYDLKIRPIILFLFVALTIPYILEIINRIVFKREGETGKKTFVKKQSTIKNSITKAIIAIMTLPDKAYTSLHAEVVSLYRLLISKKHLLEWVTAEEAEKSSKNSLYNYYINMMPNIIVGTSGIISLFFLDLDVISKVLILLIYVLWIIAPLVMYLISKPIKQANKIYLLTKCEKDYVIDIAKRTWMFFKDYLNEKTNYLPPDNYQEDRIPKAVLRTSSTNIGLGMLSVISSYDMEFESLKDTVSLLEKMINTVCGLQKWNGHLYNWYNLENLQPLTPRFVSSVDSGNFVGYLYVVLQFLENVKKDFEDVDVINSLTIQIKALIDNTDFSKLFDYKTNLFSVGFDVEENKLVESYYDLLASEARQASLVAIAKKDVDVKNWYNLSRTLTVLNKYKGLISWSGTAFEYLMPNINIPKYPGSLLDESCKFMIMSQKEYAKKLEIPWGISESAFNLKDLNNNYQYKAFGIPWLGLKRGLADEMVVSAYGSILAITDDPKMVIDNLKRLEKYGMYNKYGFYESIDFTPNRVDKNKKYENVKTYMAHHQALILLSINNLINNNVLQKRFMQNPEMQSINILLEERMPENVIITKEKKEKIEKIKYDNFDFYSENTFNKIDSYKDRYNLISNKSYTIIMDYKGNGYSKFKDIMINRFKPTSDVEQGIYFYIKNIKNKKTWTSGYNQNVDKPDKYSVTFAPDKTRITRIDGNIETKMRVTVSPNDSVEIRRLEIKNIGNTDETLEISSVLEPVLSTKEQDYAHPAFNNLFLSFEYIEENNTILVKRKKRSKNQKEIFMAINLYSEDKSFGDLEFEINKERFIGRNNYGIPKFVENSKPLSKKIELSTDSIIAMRKTINVKARESIILDLVICVSEDREYVLKTIKHYLNMESNKRIFELSRGRIEAENRYLEITGKDILLYQKLLNHILESNKDGIEYSNKQYPINELWKYGISGDYPIIFVKIKSVNDIDVIKELIKAYEYFKLKNLEIDLVILNEERDNYDSYVKDAILDSILNRNMIHMLNVKGGIYVLNNVDDIDKELISVYSKLIIDARDGNLNLQLNDLDTDVIKISRNIENEIVEKIEEVNTENKLLNMNLKYYNEYGGFSQDGKEYIIRVNKNETVPMPWSHIMANEKFGTLVTEASGGYTWYKNCRLNRVSAWSNNPVLDIPSEIIYFKDCNSKKAWSMGVNPMPDNNDYYISYGFGYAKYSHECCGIKQEMDVFVPKDDSVKVQIIKLKNETLSKRNIKLVYYLKPVLGEDEEKTKGYLRFKFDRNSNIILARNIINSDYDNTLFVSCSEKIKSYTGIKKEFFGNVGLRNPDGLKLDNFSNQFPNKLSTIIALEIEIELEALESKDISIVLGTGETIIECKDLAYKYSDLNNCSREYRNVKRFWNESLSTIQVSTPIESMNILLNGWCMYQTITSRMWGRTGFYQSGGAFGFRDQLQDGLSCKYLNPEITKKQIIKHSKHQFIEGDVEHWWHEETGRGIRTRFSDDLLWLVYAVTDYINFTNDYSLLDVETNYLNGDTLTSDIDERYDLYASSEQTGTIYEHCIKAIEKSLNFGEHGLPRIGSGDWNDGFSTVGNKGKGESVWLGFFLCAVLNDFIKICKYKNDVDRAEKYEEIIEKLRKTINTNAWDGRWYNRAFMDDGKVLGSLQNDECKIDSIAQSWSVISNMGDNDKKYISMESLENHLVDNENGLIKLLDPPFEKSDLEPGYIKAYLPGTRENGGQYTHAAIWVIIAEAMLGFGDKAVDFFRMINPIEHSKTKDGVIKYKVEPYVIPADIYGKKNLAGRGGWTWYTGSSSWMYIAGIKYILGLNIEDGYMFFNPRIANDWKEYSVRYKYGKSVYNIKFINNRNGNLNAKLKVILNGEIIEGGKIKLEDDSKIYEIECIIE